MFLGSNAYRIARRASSVQPYLPRKAGKGDRPPQTPSRRQGKSAPLPDAQHRGRGWERAAPVDRIAAALDPAGSRWRRLVTDDDRPGFEATETILPMALG